MGKSVVRVAMAQMLVEGGRPQANLARAAGRIAEAGRRGAQVVVLPECLDVGWTHPSARELAGPIPGPHVEALAGAARAAGVYVVAGLVERADDRLYNASVLLSPAGELLLHHRKINELDIAHDLYALGQSLGVAATPLGTIGIPICADNAPRSLALGYSLARMGAQLLLSPCAWAVPADYDNGKTPYGGMWQEAYTALARLYDLAVVGVSNVGRIEGGPWAGWDCIGHSLAVAPGGAVAAELAHGAQAEELGVIELPVTPRPAPGTTYAALLESRGYVGP